jgi:hypothetical protein
MENSNPNEHKLRRNENLDAASGPNVLELHEKGLVSQTNEMAKTPAPKSTFFIFLEMG